MTTFKALATARRNLWHRIDRYLAELEKRASEPGRREGDHLLRALDYLEAGTYAEGERDVMWAEVATRQPDASELHPTASPQDLRKRFAAIAEVHFAASTRMRSLLPPWSIGLVRRHPSFFSPAPATAAASGRA